MLLSGYCKALIFLVFLSHQTNRIGDNMQSDTQVKPITVMTVQQASEYLGLAVSTLNKWRCHGGGPVFSKMGRSVRYQQQNLDNYIETSKRSSTSDFII